MAVYWTFTCQCAIKAILQPKEGFVYALQSLACLASNNSLYFPLDDDLGKSDSSSGSMDSIQVGPTSLIKGVRKRAAFATNMWLEFRLKSYRLHT